MCTAICLRNKNHYFGRNLDVDFSYLEQVVITPRNYTLSLRNKTTLKTKYSLVGMASVINNYPLYYEASNEMELAIAGLNFPNNAFYNKPKINKNNICLFELIPYLLGTCKNINEVKDLLKDLNITDDSFTPNLPNSPLHFLISDKDSSIVVESIKEGLKVYDNPFDVMTNNPPFPYHVANMSNYRNLSPRNDINTFADDLLLKTYCVGMGSIGLPGDTSSPSRFVRSCFNLKNLPKNLNEVDSITNFFHVLDSVSMVKGSTITNTNKLDITLYSCCIDTTNFIYYYKWYDNNRINAIKVTEELMNKDDITCFDVMKNQDINYQN